jgi:TraY domain-containing protein
MERKRKGRPSLGKRVGLGLRVTPETKKLLDDAAARSGRSQSQEAEFRLERSFDRSELLLEVLTLTYGRRLAGLLNALGMVMSTAGALAGRDPLRRDDWANEYHTYRAAQQAVELLLMLWKPPELDAKGENARNPSEHGLDAVESLIDVLAKWEKLKAGSPDAYEKHNLLGPLAPGMVDAFPDFKKDFEKRQQQVRAMVDAADRKVAAEQATAAKRRA